MQYIQNVQNSRIEWKRPESQYEIAIYSWRPFWAHGGEGFQKKELPCTKYKVIPAFTFGPSWLTLLLVTDMLLDQFHWLVEKVLQNIWSDVFRYWFLSIGEWVKYRLMNLRIAWLGQVNLTSSKMYPIQKLVSQCLWVFSRLFLYLRQLVAESLLLSQTRVKNLTPLIISVRQLTEGLGSIQQCDSVSSP